MNILNKEKIIEAARAFIDEGKFDRAIREYEKILLADPADMRVKLRIAELYTKRKQIAEAIRVYREVADAYAAEGFFLKAVTVHKNILRLNPSLNETNEQLAILYEKMGLVGDAIRQYDILASSLDMKGQVDRVIDIRSKIVRLAPKDGASRIKLAEIFQREGRMEESIDQYEEYARQLEESGGDRAKLADLFEKVLAYRPDKHEMQRKLIRIYEDLGEHKKALKCLETGKEFVERDPELLSLMARIYASQNQNETARSKYVMLAELEAEAGRVDAALDAYVDILVLMPDEEDRLARRVEELKAGGIAEVSERARKRREELEQEESRRQEAESAREAALEAEKEKEKEKGKPRPPQAPKPSTAPPVPPAASEGNRPVVVRENMQAPAAKEAPAFPSPPKAAEGPPDRSSADGAFDLGLVYQRMGLSDEAAAEFAKARDIYAACLNFGMQDPDIPQRLAGIEAAMAGEPAREPVKIKDAQAAPAAGREVDKGEEKAKEEKKPAEAKPEEKKKKISFV